MTKARSLSKIFEMCAGADWAITSSGNTVLLHNDPIRLAKYRVKNVIRQNVFYKGLRQISTTGDTLRYGTCPVTSSQNL
jgi:hypothetical protein